ncbi:MAG: hypothetical protein J0L79_01695 [Rickettsiales bacterium]|nr:hypothetical protein [Rickettsiales bacterium]
MKNIDSQNDLNVTHSITIKLSGLGKYAPATIERLTRDLPLLRALDLSHNRIGEYGPETSKQLVKFLELTSVDMGFNYLREHAKEIAKSLATIPSLQNVNMRNNEICLNDISIIVDIFLTSSLHCLDIGGNGLLTQANRNEINDKVQARNGSYKAYIEELHAIILDIVTIDLVGVVENYLETPPIQVILE